MTQNYVHHWCFLTNFSKQVPALELLYFDIKNISCLQWSNNEHNPKLHGWKEICWCLFIWLNNCWVEWVFLIHAIASISLHLYPVSALNIFKLTLTFISRRAYTLTCYNYSKLLNIKYEQKKQNKNKTRTQQYEYGLLL